VEAAAEGEDSLLEKYLEAGSLSDEELIRGLKKVVQSGAFIPVYCAAGGHSLGVIPLLNGIVDLLPSPAQAKARVAEGREGPEELTASDAGPLAAYVWKTTADPFVGRMTFFRVFSGSVHADAHVWNQTKGAEERMSGLHLQRGKEQIPAKVIQPATLAQLPNLQFVHGRHPVRQEPSADDQCPQVPCGPLQSGDRPENTGRCGEDKLHTDAPV
jgi:elongation factor G